VLVAGWRIRPGEAQQQVFRRKLLNVSEIVITCNDDITASTTPIF